MTGLPARQLWGVVLVLLGLAALALGSATTTPWTALVGLPVAVVGLSLVRGHSGPTAVIGLVTVALTGAAAVAVWTASDRQYAINPGSSAYEYCPSALSRARYTPGPADVEQVCAPRRRQRQVEATQVLWAGAALPLLLGLGGAAAPRIEGPRTP